MLWKAPHIEKIYEALTDIADKRIVILSETSAKCTSSSRKKYYNISYDPATGAMMSNDNSAYWTDSLSHPMIAFLMTTGHLNFDNNILPYFENILWKDINQKFKNDYDKAVEYILSEFTIKSYPIENIKIEIDKIYDQICLLKVEQLGQKVKPSTVY